MRKSFTWFFSLLVLLTAFATHGFAQEEQETVELYAEDASYCYNEANDYSVTISVRDFIRLTKFDVNLHIENDVDLEYVDCSDTIPSLDNGAFLVSESGGIINISWDGDAVTIGDNEITPILKLHFSVPNFPDNVGPVYESILEWGSAEFWYTDGEVYDLVNTIETFDGNLAVTVEKNGITTDIIPESCAGGDATVVVTAPEADMYLFNEGSDVSSWTWTPSNEYNALAGEAVTVRVKDAEGCMSLMETVEIPMTIDSVEFTVTTEDARCYGGNGSVVFTNVTGGTAPYTYLVHEVDEYGDPIGSLIEKENFQFSMAPGYYWVTVQDANGCVDLNDQDVWEYITIEDNNPEVDGTVSVTNVTCNGGSDGEIVIAMEEDGTLIDTDSYELSIDGGTTWLSTADGHVSFNETTGEYSISGLMAGSYDLRAKNSNGCKFGEGSDPVDVGEPDPITFDMDIVDISCSGEQYPDDGQIIVSNIVGGTPPYTVTIEENENSTDSIVDTEGGGTTFTDLKPTYYSLIIEDAQSCIVEYENPNNTENVIAVQAPEEIRFEVDITDPLCFGDDAMLTIYDVTPVDGSYEYSFDDGATWVDTMSMDWTSPYNAVIVTVRNDDGTCPVSKTYDASDVGGPQQELDAEILTDSIPPTCYDGNDGNITLEITGGTSPYSYSVNGGPWQTTEETSINIKVARGIAEIMVKDANECTGSFSQPLSIDVEQDPNEIYAYVPKLGDIECYGESTGEIDVEFITWAGGLTTEEVPNRTYQVMVEDLATGHVSGWESGPAYAAGTYVIWGVDQYGCESNTDTVEIEQAPELEDPVVEVVQHASCYQTYQGIISVSVMGGSQPLEYAWVNNAVALENIEESRWQVFDEYNSETTESTVTFNVDGGTYYIAVRDNCDKEVYSDQVQVDGYDELLVDESLITFQDPLCAGQEDGWINVPEEAVSGGAGAADGEYLYTLLQNVDRTWIEVEGHVDQATGLFENLDQGSYAVLVEDSEDCPSYTTEDPIVLDDPVALTFGVDYLHMSCENANNGVIEIDADGGTGEYSYAINDNNWQSFSEGSDVVTYIATEPGTYEVWVKDENECMAGPHEVTILEPTALDANILDTDSASCYGEADGSITVEGIGGWEDLGYSDYMFTINDWTTWYSASEIAALDLPAGDHILHVKDVYLYESNTEHYQNMECSGEVLFTIDEPDPITYTVHITDVKCKGGEDGTLTVEIIDGGTPYVDETDPDNSGFDVKLTGADYNSGPIRTGADNTHIFEDLAHSHYTVYIEDANGCTLAPPIGEEDNPYTTEESWEVNEPDTELTLDPQWVQDVTCYGGEDGQFTADADGGTPPYQYYAGLSVEPDGHILVPEHPAVDSEEWQDSEVFNVGAGTWVVWVMDENGCIVGGEYNTEGIAVNHWRVQIEQPDSLGFELATDSVSEPDCYGSWDGSIWIDNIWGGTAPYNVSVTGLSAGGMVVDTVYEDVVVMEVGAPESPSYIGHRGTELGGLPASDEDGFVVTVWDANECASESQIVHIDQPEELTVELVPAPGEFECAGDISGDIKAIVSGGTAPYEYKLLKNGNLHTDWQSVSNMFLVESGNTFTVQVMDANECGIAEAELEVTTPDPVMLDMQPLSCYGDEMASGRVTATVDEGREFMIEYKEIVNGVGGSWITYEDDEEAEWFTGSVDMIYEFHFDGENLQDRHYAIRVVDDHGCESEIDTFTFDPVQNELILEAMIENQVITANANGGAVDSEMDSQYEYALSIVDGDIIVEWQTDNTFNVEEYNEYVVWVRDHHLRCTATDTVVGGAPVHTIAEIQGEAASSPVEGTVVSTVGTVTALLPDDEGTIIGFSMQDSNNPWSGIIVMYDDAGDLSRGDDVEVLGTVEEIDNMTTLVADMVSTGELTFGVEPVVMDGPSSVADEQWESMLVKVEGGRANALDTETGEWVVYTESDNTIPVDDGIYAYEPTEGNFYDVTGIVNGTNDNFMLEPRDADDITDLTATPADMISEGFEVNVYPNPFSDYIMIKNSDKVVRAVINNIAGQKVMDVKYPDSEIRTDNLVSGVYVISLFTEGDERAKSLKLIKE